MSEIQRNPDGTFVAGGPTPNPLGANGHKKGWQRYGTRAKYWLEKLTAHELRELVTDADKFGKLSSIDAIVVRHLVNTLVGDDIRQERKDLLDRIEGQPTQKIAGDSEADPIQAQVTNDAAAAIAGIVKQLAIAKSASVVNPPEVDRTGKAEPDNA